MFVHRRFNPKLIRKSRLLGVYMALLIDHNPNTPILSGIEYKDKLKGEFGYEASLVDIDNYFRPNFYENRLDVEQQMKNLQIRYD